MIRCPICQSPSLELKQRSSEYCTITEVDPDLRVIARDVDETDDVDLVHIHCGQCDKYWYSESEFLGDYANAHPSPSKKPKGGFTPRKKMTKIGPATFTRPPVKRYIILNKLSGEYYCRKWQVGKDYFYFRAEQKRARLFYSEAHAKVACRYIHKLTMFKNNPREYSKDLDLGRNLDIICVD